MSVRNLVQIEIESTSSEFKCGFIREQLGWYELYVKS